MADSMRDDILAIPDHLRDALWRIDSARLQPGEAAGLIVCGMGGSAIGGDLAAAALGERLVKQLAVVRGYKIPSWATGDWTVLCSSYSGNTEETLSCFAAAGDLGARRIVAGTGGALVDAAREAGVPVVGLPGILQPRAAVAYMFAIAAEVAALSGVGPGIRTEIEAAADFLAEQTGAMKTLAGEIGAKLEGTVPVICGADLTVPVARRWKTQINENAKLPAFFSELPEADHNELCGWDGAAPTGTQLAAVFLEDPDQDPRERKRLELTAAAVAAAEVDVVRVEVTGESRAARLLWAVMIGDLVSLDLAERRGVDPLPVEAIERFKTALARP